MYNVEQPARHDPRMNYQQATHQQSMHQQAAYDQRYPQMGGTSGRVPRWDISYQENKSLYVFNATSDTYAGWT